MLLKSITNLTSFCKKYWCKYRDTRPHYGLRTILCLLSCAFCIYALKCFLTIPVKDYYFDNFIYTADSVSLEIDLTIGENELLSTHSSPQMDSAYSHCTLRYNVEKHHNSSRKRHIKKDLQIERIMDKTLQLAKTDDRFRQFNSTYDFQNRLRNNPMDYTYIYSYAYINASTSATLLSIHNPYKKHIYKILFHESSNFINDSVLCWIANDSVRTMYLPYMKDSDMYNMLSNNHVYYEKGTLLRVRPQSRETPLIEDLKTPTTETLGKFFGLLLQKEDISQAYFRFTVRSGFLDSYRITFHTRGGAIINNNPSGELEVLSLHDTQITKKPNVNEKWDVTDLHVSFPERNNIQYIRLFFLTLLLGELLKQLIVNLLKLCENKKK